MINLNASTDITPTEFELQVKGLLERFEKIPEKFEILHNVNEKGYDGEYQIDIKVTYQMLGAEFVVLVECKNHRSPIKRETIQILNDRIRSLGAHKGILVSTSDFQAGAIKYAKLHGIALANVVEGALTYQVKSKDKKHSLPEGFPAFMLIWVEQSESGVMHTNLNFGYIEEFERGIFKNKKV